MPKIKYQRAKTYLKYINLFVFLICVFYFLFFVFCFNQAWAATPEITRVDIKRDRGLDYLDVYTTGYVKAKGLLADDQLIIEFPDVQMAPGLNISQRQSKRIENITTAQDAQAAQIVVKLKAEIDYDIVNVFGQNKSVIEISDRVGRGEQIMLAWEAANLKLKADKLESYKLGAPASKVGLPLAGKTIVVDPGHGGQDPGSFSKSGVAEKYLTLPTAQKIAAKLNAAGATVYLTRNSDRTVSIRDIVTFANQAGADAFISVHYNYYPSEKVAGAETYYYNSNSRRLALTTHQALLYGLKRKDRGLRQAMYYTIHHVSRPAILIEPLYISNWEEQKLASSKNYQNQIAACVTEGVINYFRN